MSDSNIDKIKIIQIKDYYKEIDNPKKNIIIEQCEKKPEFRNFINDCKDLNIYLFKQKKDKWSLKTKRQLLNECENKKKKYLKKYKNNLANLAKLNSNKEIINKSNENHNDFLKTIKKINKIENDNNLNELKKIFSSSHKFIEIYSN